MAGVEISCVHIVAAAEYQRVIVSVVLEVVSTLSCWCHCECLNRSSCKASLPPPRVIQTIPDISHADYLASGQSVSDYIRQVIDSFRSKTVVAGYQKSKWRTLALARRSRTRRCSTMSTTSTSTGATSRQPWIIIPSGTRTSSSSPGRAEDFLVTGKTELFNQFRKE